jgi:hypothetical protein
VNRVTRFSAAAVLAALTACGGGGGGTSSSSHTLSPSQSAAIATVRAQAQDYLAKCLPAPGASGIAQLNFGRSLLTSDGRQKFTACLAIPPANRKAFEGELLTAAEHVKWTDKAQRHTALFVTLPALVQKYHGAAPYASIPGVTVTPTVSPGKS